MREQVTLMRPDARDPTTARAMSSGLPVDLISQSAGRLRVLALLYAFVFFMEAPIGSDRANVSHSVRISSVCSLMNLERAAMSVNYSILARAD